MSLVYLTPVLRRPKAVAPLLDFIAIATPEAQVLFLVDDDDEPEIAAINDQRERIAKSHPQLKVDILGGGGSYAKKINRGVAATDADYIFIGADDLEPQPGWFEAAKKFLDAGYGVVGVMDTILRKRKHQTHYLVTREYAEQPCIDGSPGPMCEIYEHNFVDDEFVGTAKHRKQYAVAEDAIVVHNHPSVGTAPDDATYKKGRESFERDRQRAYKRANKWR